LDITTGNGFVSLKKPSATGDVIGLCLASVFVCCGMALAIVLLMLLGVVACDSELGILWRVAGVACLGSLVGLVFWVLKLLVRAFLPVEARLEVVGPDSLRCVKRIAGLRVSTRRIQHPSVIVVSPVYLRGDWGFLLAIHDCHGHRTALSVPELVGDKMLARDQGRVFAAKVADAVNIDSVTEGGF
jgi:hypothetical protein